MFEVIHEARYIFYTSQKMEPDTIIMPEQKHPEFVKLLEASLPKFSQININDTFKYAGMDIIRSIDVDEIKVGRMNP